MSRAAALPPGLIAALRGFRTSGPELLDDDLPGLDLWRLECGSRSTFYMWRPGQRPIDPDRDICFKLHTGQPRSATREQAALSHLAEHGLVVTPGVLWHEDDDVMPITAMVPLVGASISSPSTPSAALDGITTVLNEIGALPVERFTNLARDGALEERKRWVVTSWRATLNWRRQSRHTEIVGELKALMGKWMLSSDIRELTRPAPVVLSPGNANLNDWMWDPETSRSYPIDLGSIGASDAVYDLADHIEHPTARRFSDADWARRLPDHGVDDDQNYHRLVALQRLLSLFWLRTLWPYKGEPTEAFVAQLARVRHLFKEFYV